MSTFSVQHLNSSIAISMDDISNFYYVNATGGNVVITLPSMISSSLTAIEGIGILFYKTDGTANTVTINCYSGQTFENLGTNTYVLSTQYSKIRFLSVNSNWIVV